MAEETRLSRRMTDFRHLERKDLDEDDREEYRRTRFGGAMHWSIYLTEECLSRVDAPAKHFVWFETSAQFPFHEEPAAFAQQMRDVINATNPRAIRQMTHGCTDKLAA